MDFRDSELINNSYSNPLSIILANHLRNDRLQIKLEY